MRVVSRKFSDRKSAKEFAEANGLKVERYIDPTGYFKFIVRFGGEEKKDSKKDKSN